MSTPPQRTLCEIWQDYCADNFPPSASRLWELSSAARRSMREAGDAKAACLLYVIGCVFSDLAAQIDGDPVEAAEWDRLIEGLFVELGRAIALIGEENYGRALDTAAAICSVHRPPGVRH